MSRHWILLAGLLALFFGASRAGAATSPTLTIGSVTGVLGDDVIVTATASNLKSCTAWGFRLSYETAKLKVVSVESGTATSDWSSVSGRVVNGVLRIGGFAGTQGNPISGDNVQLCKITFHLKSGAGASVALTPSSPSDGLRRATLVAGSVMITAPTPLTLTVGNGSGTVGSNVTVSVKADGLAANTTAWGFSLAYDSAKVRAIAVQRGTATSDWASVAGQASGGKVRVGGFAGADGTAIRGDAQILCKITFYLKKGGGTTVTLTPYDLQKGLRGAAVVAGKLTIAKP